MQFVTMTKQWIKRTVKSQNFGKFLECWVHQRIVVKFNAIAKFIKHPEKSAAD